jgi:phage gpG-like protein
VADAVRIEGLADLRRDLREMHPDVRREVTKALKEGATVVARAAGPHARKGETGKLADSFRPGAAGNAAFVRSRLPYAAVHEFGGVIRPRGVPITIRAQPAATRALADKEESIVEKVGDALDGVFSRHGFR